MPSIAAEPCLSSPKVGLADGSSPWYRYYAGYSVDFVRDCLKFLSPPPESLVLDPWNGSGTTTYVAAQQGFASLGFDANPALLVVAKARVLGLDVAPSITTLVREITSRASATPWEGEARSDPLARWVTPRAATAIRSLEQAIQHLLVKSNVYRSLAGAGRRRLTQASEARPEPPKFVPLALPS